MNKFVEKCIKFLPKIRQNNEISGTFFCQVRKSGKLEFFGTYHVLMWISWRKALTFVMYWHIIKKPGQDLAYLQFFLAQGQRVLCQDFGTKKEEKRMECFYCEKAEKLESLMLEIAVLKASTVYLNRDQKHEGRVIIALNRHADEYHELGPEERNQYFKEVAMIGQAMANIYGTDKINYGTYGDLVSHVHVHMVPKHKDGLQWGAPFRDGADTKVFLAQAEYEVIVAKLRAEILALEKTFE